jgi:predicted nucleic acid-binding protein
MPCPGSLLILDDALGRRIAVLSELRITGTIGVIVKAKEAGLLPQVAPALRALEQTTMRMSPALVRKALELAREL